MLTSIKRLSTIAIAAAAIFTTASSASAFAISTTPHTEIGTITDSPVSIDYWVFEVEQNSIVTLDVLSRDVLAGENPRNSISTLNTEILLFNYDENGSQGLLGSFIDSNDDSDFLGTDGSTSTRDSHLTAALNIGTYALAVSGFRFTEEEARANDNSNSSFVGTSSDYQVTFTATPLTNIVLPAVPLPAGLPLLIGGFGALSLLRRKKSKSKQA